MKTLARICFAVAIIAIAVPALAKDKLAAPMQQKIPPGITTISYAGQQLRFSSSQGLIVRFESLDDVRFKLTVRVYGASRGELERGGKDSGENYSTVGGGIDIYWENFGSEVYSGSLVAPFEGILNSESGFTEK